MKKIHLLLYFTSLLLVMSCGKEVAKTPLPFYNSADFTPEWIDSDDPAYQTIHVIDDFSFTNQEGEAVTNEQLEGKVYVADFFFTVCPGICPKMTTNLASIKETYGPEEVKLVSFSVMPWADSVEVLKNYADVRGIDSRQWHLLTGETEKIYDLARSSYFAEKEIGLDKDSDEFLHTESFILVDQKGRIRGVYNGTLLLEMKRLKQDIKTLLELG